MVECCDSHDRLIKENNMFYHIKHLFLGLILVFSAYILTRFILCVRIDIWWLPVGNTVVILGIVLLFSNKPDGHRYDMIDFWQSVWNFGTGTLGGWIMYRLVMLIK